MAIKIAIIVVGALKRDAIRETIEDYLDRIGRYTAVELIRVKPWKGSTAVAETLSREAQRLSGLLRKDDLVVVLDEQGGELTTQGFADWLDRVVSYSTRKRLCFVVGGSFGLYHTIKQRADRVMALSKLTLAYELATLILVEQIYRAFTIIRGEPYSH